jgi:AcrR family transcriptional regulator
MNVVNIVDGVHISKEVGPVARAYHHGALAEAMVEQALGAVREHGAEQVSLRAIAQALDVSPSAAYNHFADKDALLVAVGECGLAALDERMARSLAAHPGDSDEAARRRFAGLGRAYISFAVEDPHLFRLVFGPICMKAGEPPEEGGPYLKLCSALDELNERGLLAPGTRESLDITVWGATHGVASLMIDGLLPPDAGDSLIESFARLVLRVEGDS